jgi:hypothetical protein
MLAADVASSGFIALLYAYVHLLVLKDKIGTMRALVGADLVRREARVMCAWSMVAVRELVVQQEGSRASFLAFAPMWAQQRYHALSTLPCALESVRLRTRLLMPLERLLDDDSPEDAEEWPKPSDWFLNMTCYIDSLDTLAVDLTKEVARKVEDSLHAGTTRLVRLLSPLLFATIPLAMALLRGYSLLKQAQAEQATGKKTISKLLHYRDLAREWAPLSFFLVTESDDEEDEDDVDGGLDAAMDMGLLGESKPVFKNATAASIS